MVSPKLNGDRCMRSFGSITIYYVQDPAYKISK